jgi:hypothetical protein
MTMNRFSLGKFSRQAAKQTLIQISSTVLLLAGMVAPGFASDPFRTSNPRPISDRTESAFNALFAQGNYTAAANYLNQLDPSDPLALAMKAALTYLNWQNEPNDQRQEAFLEQFRSYADQTQTAAQNLLSKDPLRGNLYLAVGHFLDGAYVILKEGAVKGTPQVLAELNNVMKYLKTAEGIAPQDPELNLLKGYMDLFTAVNLPFSNPMQAIERLNQYASPRYLADRGVALGYRDMNQLPQALAAVDRALKATPSNPELYYLKAQILARQGDNRGSIPYFEQALQKQGQLPPSLARQINRELQRAKQRMNNVGQ